mmetsp:Transcript_51675/g.116461  ORF Transcript_51675/g.116461 Transcript_51675/m.116461 type:complete len:259 (+) Transcript_51675:41-817(+)
MAPKDSLLAIVLDGSTLSALQEASQALSESAEEILCTPNAGFSPCTLDELRMTFILFGPRISQLRVEDACNLGTELRRLLASTWRSTREELLQFRGFQMWRGDMLIARYQASAKLMQLRKAAWRLCGTFGISCPDALWVPHVRLGRIRATKPQLARLSLAKLQGFMPRQQAQAVAISHWHPWPEEQVHRSLMEALSVTQVQQPDGEAESQQEMAASAAKGEAGQPTAPQPASPPKGSPKAGVAPQRVARVRGLQRPDV